MSHSLRQSDFDYDPENRLITAPHDTPRPWHGIELAVAHELGEKIHHGNTGDLYFDEPHTKVPATNPLNPLDRPLPYYIIGEIRSATVRTANGQRGRFQLRRQQHEYLLRRAKHMPHEFHDRYLFAVYDVVEPGVWRLLDYSSVTAPELDRTRETWTWSRTHRYEVAQVTWSKIPGLDPLQIEADHDGYWTLNDYI